MSFLTWVNDSLFSHLLKKDDKPITIQVKEILYAMEISYQAGVNEGSLATLHSTHEISMAFMGMLQTLREKGVRVDNNTIELCCAEIVKDQKQRTDAYDG